MTLYMHANFNLKCAYARTCVRCACNRIYPENIFLSGIRRKPTIRSSGIRLSGIRCTPDSNPSPVPVSKMDTAATQSKPFHGPYKAVVGSVISPMITARPDIAFAISRVCSRMAEPSAADWTSVKKVMRYLKGTKEKKLILSGRHNLTLSAYCDSDWAGDSSDRKSTSRFIVFLGKSLISWTSKKQNTVAHSTMESKFLA